MCRKLTRNLAGGDILLLHDGNAASGKSGFPVIHEALPGVLAALAARNLTTTLMRSALY